MAAYNNVDIPDGKKPSAYTYTERRSEILGMIVEAGHPDLVSRKKLGGYYDVTPQTIGNDIQAIEDEVQGELGSDADFITDTVYRKAIRKCMEDNQYLKAVQMVESFNDWLVDRGRLEKAPEKHAIATGEMSDEEREEMMLGLLEDKSSDGSRDLRARMMDAEDAPDPEELEAELEAAAGDDEPPATAVKTEDGDIVDISVPENVPDELLTPVGEMSDEAETEE